MVTKKQSAHDEMEQKVLQICSDIADKLGRRKAEKEDFEPGVLRGSVHCYIPCGTNTAKDVVLSILPGAHVEVWPPEDTVDEGDMINVYLDGNGAPVPKDTSWDTSVYVYLLALTPCKGRVFLGDF